MHVRKMLLASTDRQIQYIAGNQPLCTSKVASERSAFKFPQY